MAPCCQQAWLNQFTVTLILDANGKKVYDQPELWVLVRASVVACWRSSFWVISSVLHCATAAVLLAPEV